MEPRVPLSWRVIPVNKYLVKPIYKPKTNIWKKITPGLGDMITMDINHFGTLYCGIILSNPVLDNGNIGFVLLIVILFPLLPQKSATPISSLGMNPCLDEPFAWD